MDVVDREAEVLLPRPQWSRRGFVMTSLITGFALSTRPVSVEAIHSDATGLEAGEVKVRSRTAGSRPTARCQTRAGRFRQFSSSRKCSACTST